MQKIARNKGLLGTEVTIFFSCFYSERSQDKWSRYKIGICCESL